MNGKGDARRPEATKGAFDKGRALIKWPSDERKEAGEKRLKKPRDRG